MVLSNSMDVVCPLITSFHWMMVENDYAYSECTEKDVDIEKVTSGTPRINEEKLGDLKNEEQQI
nr:integrin-linked protein kinase family [Tanacetum cinerariifolium]